MRLPFVSAGAHFQALARVQDQLEQALTWRAHAVAAQRRYDDLVAEVLRRGLKDEKETVAIPADDKPLPNVIAKALSQWPEGSAPYVQNRNYAFAQMIVRPDDAEGIAAEISQGEDVELFS